MANVIEPHGNALIVRIGSPIDLIHFREMQGLMERTLAARSARVILDLSQVSRVDTSGISLLLDWDRAVQTAGKEFRMFSIPSLLKQLRIGEHIATYNSEVEAFG